MAMKKCKECEKEVSTKAKKCPHCGAKLKMGKLLKLITGVVVFLLAAIMMQPSEENKAKTRQEMIEKISNAQPTQISPSGEIARIFNIFSDFTDIQRDNKEKELKGKIIEWQLKVYEVSKYEDYYKVQTSSGSAVGTFVNVYTRNESEKAYLENLKTGSDIKIKGEISGVFMRNIEIDPAVLVSK